MTSLLFVVLALSSGAEEFYIEVGAQNVCKLYQETCGGNGVKKDDEVGIEQDQEANDALDDLALDDSRAYKKKITRYIGRSLDAVSDVRFWACMHLCHKARGPLMHFYRILNSKGFAGRMRITELVSYRIQAIESEFGALAVSFQTWFSLALDFATGVGAVESGGGGGDADAARLCVVDRCAGDRLMDMAAACMLRNVGAFNRRVVRVFKRWLANKIMYLCMFGSVPFSL